MAREWGYRVPLNQGGLPSITGLTLYGVLVNELNQIWNGASWESFFNPAHLGSYAIAFTEDNLPTGSGFYTAAMPSGVIVVGRYWMMIFAQVGVSPNNDSDIYLSNPWLDWYIDPTEQLDLTVLYTELLAIYNKLASAGSITVAQPVPDVNGVFNIHRGCDYTVSTPLGFSQVPAPYSLSGASYVVWNPQVGAPYDGFSVVSPVQAGGVLSFYLEIDAEGTQFLSGGRNDYQIRPVLPGGEEPSPLVDSYFVLLE